jgi:hypothetical protein
MAEFLTRNLKLAISQTPEASYNAIKSASGDLYYGMLTTGRAFYVPDKEKVDDTGKIGTGREFPTEQRSTYVAVPSLELTEELNVDIAPIILRRAMGGADVVTTIAATPASTIRDHTWGLDLSGTNRQLPSSSMLWGIIGSGADYLWSGVVIESFAINQTNSDVPTFTASFVGSGLFKRLKYLTADGNIAVNGSNPYTGPYPGSAGTEWPPTFPLPTAQRYMIGAESELLFTPEGGSPYSMTASGQRLKAFSATLTNNHRTDDRRPGDPRIVAAQPRSGHYVNRMNHGDRTIGGDMTVMLDDTLAEFDLAYNDTILESFTYKAKGRYLMATAPGVESDKQSEFEITFPKAYLRSVAGTDDNGDAVLTMSVFPIDNGTTGPMIARIRNNTAAVIV